MRLRHLSMIIAVASLAASCKAADKNPADAGAGSGPAPTASVDSSMLVGPNDVGMRLSCIDEDSVAFELQGWRRRITLGASGKWVLTNNSVASVKLTPFDTGVTWPFPGKPRDIVAKRGSTPFTHSLVKGDTILRYTITGICTRPSGRVDTIIIDPIMILPN